MRFRISAGSNEYPGLHLDRYPLQRRRPSHGGYSVVPPGITAPAETSRPLYVFTPNSPAELRVALTVGADAVITDHVTIAVELRRTRR